MYICRDRLLILPKGDYDCSRWLAEKQRKETNGTHRHIIAHLCGDHSLEQPTGEVEFKKQRYLSTSKTGICWWKAGCSEFGRKSFHTLNKEYVSCDCDSAMHKTFITKVGFGFTSFPATLPSASSQPLGFSMDSFGLWDMRCKPAMPECWGSQRNDGSAAGKARRRIERVLMDSDQFIYIKYCLAFCVNIKIVCRSGFTTTRGFASQPLKGQSGIKRWWCSRWSWTSTNWNRVWPSSFRRWMTINQERIAQSFIAKTWA